MPYFSIVIPTLNEENYVPRLLKNLNEQSFTDFEAVVVDGESTDKTTTIVKSFPAHYPLKLITAKKHNVSFQRNEGARQTTGKILVFFDADTQIPKNYLEKLNHIFKTKRPHFMTTYMKVDSRKPSEQWFAALTNTIFEISRIVKTPSAYGAMQAIKRGAFEDFGGYDENTLFGEDSQLFQNAQDYNYKFYVSPTPRYIFSLRRLRAEGTLDTMYQFLKLNLSIIINGYHASDIKYEMGGGRYKNMQNNAMTRRFDRLFVSLKKRSAKQSLLLKTFLDKLS
jgi:glycosyltransferase involved in cell wall biosynthesis